MLPTDKPGDAHNTQSLSDFPGTLDLRTLSLSTTTIELISNEGDENLASRAFNNNLHAHQKGVSANKGKKSGKQPSTSEAARKILNLIERDMQDKGLSEEEKNLRAGKFAAFVDNLTATRRKS
jgi:hypothetical protein